MLETARSRRASQPADTSREPRGWLRGTAVSTASGIGAHSLRNRGAQQRVAAGGRCDLWLPGAASGGLRLLLLLLPGMTVGTAGLPVCPSIHSSVGGGGG